MVHIINLGIALCVIFIVPFVVIIFYHRVHKGFHKEHKALRVPLKTSSSLRTMRNEMGSNLMHYALMLRLLRSYLPRKDVLIEFLEMPIIKNCAKPVIN